VLRRGQYARLKGRAWFGARIFHHSRLMLNHSSVNCSACVVRPRHG
jgi:hypothetical protein